MALNRQGLAREIPSDGTLYRASGRIARHAVSRHAISRRGSRPVGSVGPVPATAFDLRPVPFRVQPSLPRAGTRPGRPTLRALGSDGRPQYRRHPDPRGLPIADLLTMLRCADGQRSVDQPTGQPVSGERDDRFRPTRQRRQMHGEFDPRVSGIDALPTGPGRAGEVPAQRVRGDAQGRADHQVAVRIPMGRHVMIVAVGGAEGKLLAAGGH